MTTEEDNRIFISEMLHLLYSSDSKKGIHLGVLKAIYEKTFNKPFRTRERL